MKRLPILLLLLAALGFLFGLAHLFRLRFEAGDVYPEYSSLRADPLGAKAFYLGLGQLGAVRRNVQPLDQLGEGRGSTLFFLGADPTGLEFTREERRQLETFVKTGGRLVLSLFPSYRALDTNRPATAPPAPAPGAGPAARRRKAKDNSADEMAFLRPEALTRSWRVDFGHAELPRDGAGVFRPQRATRQVDGPLPDSLPCHTALFFDRLDAAWRVIYARPSNRAVLIERTLGDGTIVLCADSYLFSNEAMREERQTTLLAWLLGPNRRAVFEEVHLGVSEEPGVATLARRYRLHGLAAALVLLGGLFIWKNAAPFLPPHPDDGPQWSPDTVPGRDSATGFVHLLRRNLPRQDILAACLREWERSCARQTPRAKLEQIEAVIEAEAAREARERDTMALYRRICEILASVRRKT